MEFPSDLSYFRLVYRMPAEAILWGSATLGQPFSFRRWTAKSLLGPLCMYKVELKSIAGGCGVVVIVAAGCGKAPEVRDSRRGNRHELVEQRPVRKRGAYHEFMQLQSVRK